MAGSLNDKFTRVTDNDSGRPVIATLASSKSVGATSVTIGDATNWTSVTKVHFVIYNTVNVAGATVKDSSSQTEWQGTLSGTTISNVILTGGTDRTYNAGAIVELTPTSKWAKDLYDGLSVVHNNDGTLKANVINASTLLADGVVTASKLASNSVTTDKITNPYKFSVYRSTAFVTSNGSSIVQYDTKNFDTGTNVDIASNKGRFTAPVTGYYFFEASVNVSTTSAKRFFVSIYKNGTEVRRSYDANLSATNIYSAQVTGFFSLNSTDYIEIYSYTDASQTGVTGQLTSFSGWLVSSS